jgi:flagellar basal-body rod modification protein FlgD
MSSTNSVGSSTSTSGTSGSSNQSAISSALNISPSDFLTLITTQLQDQNPLQPTDPTQFLSQLESMSEVSSMQNMETSLGNLQTSLASTQMANGAALIGQTVLAPSSTGTLSSTSGSTIAGAVQAASGAKSITLDIINSAGVTVDTQTLTPASSGLTYFSWNGTTSSGSTAAAGQYTLKASSYDGSSTTTLSPLVASQVESVTVDSSTSALDVITENGTVPLSSVVSIL